MKHISTIIFFALALSCCDSKKKYNYQDHNNAIIDTLKVNDVELGKPKPYEWLAVHKEPGQSFEQYIKINPVSVTETQNKIYLQPIGNFSHIQDNIINYTADYLAAFFSLEIVILPALDDSIIPPSAKRYQGTMEEQLLTGSILDYLQRNIPGDGIVIMAITAKDLYPNEKFSYVFGQARTKKRVGVSSIYRFSDQQLDSSHYQVCLDRLIKTSSHEIGHMFSCQHCTYAVCVMNGSNSLVESDSRPNRLCASCHHKLQWNLKFNVVTRLKKLKAYFKKHKLPLNHRLILNDLNTIALARRKQPH